MNVSEYIATHLSDIGVKYVYGIMGGGAAGLNDGFIKCRKITYVCTHHEQGAGHAAVGESKVTKQLAVVNPTTGCGGTNCITSVLDAWQDSLPVLFISGNVKLNQTSNYINRENDTNIRKYGVQEHDIVSTVKTITKYATVVERAEDVPYELDYAIHLARQSRMGPVWLDIPSDIQHTEMPLKYKTFIPPKKYSLSNKNKPHIQKYLSKYQRPLVLAGYGITLSNTNTQFLSFINKNQLPFVTTYLGIDIVEHKHPLNMGTIGIKGSRAGNFAIQNCDLLIILGSSLNCSHTGYDEKQFSPKSFKLLVDIDRAEFKKNKTKIDKFYNIDLKEFFDNE